MNNALRILLIDDNPDDRTLVMRQLRREFPDLQAEQITEAKGFALALEAGDFDLVITDYQLRWTNGLEVLRMVKSRWPNRPVIMFTNTGNEEVAVEAMKGGLDDYVLKSPKHLVRLSAAVRLALEGARQRQALKEAENRYLSLFDRVPVGLYRSTPEGQILDANPALVHMLGYPDLQALQAVNAVDFYLDPKAREQWQALMESEGVVRDFEAQLRRRDGTVIWVRDSARAVQDDQARVLYYEGAAEDFTERKRAEKQIQLQLDRIRALHEIDLAITSTLDLRITMELLLEKIDLLLQYSSASVRLINRASGELEPVACHNLNEEAWKAYLQKTRGGLSKAVVESRTPIVIRNVQTTPRALDTEFFRKEGLISYVGLPLIAKGEILGVLALCTKEAHQFSSDEMDFLTTLAGQAAVAIHNSQLYDEIKKQALELEKSNRVKDDFLNVMSHELRTPLTSIMGYTTIVQDRLLGEINPRQEKTLGSVMRSSNELLAMVESVLTATSIEAGAFKVESHEVSLRDFLDELKSTYDAPLDKELILTWDYPSDLPVMQTDKVKLRQVLQNLISNAIKFTQKGHVTISARYQSATETVEFQVADTGIGIPKEAIPDIFERFRQMDSSGTRSYGGVGLGLHIVKAFTELLGGTVEVERKPQKGSTFTVRFPVRP